jgi:hypothetical protein
MNVDWIAEASKAHTAMHNSSMHCSPLRTTLLILLPQTPWTTLRDIRLVTTLMVCLSVPTCRITFLATPPINPSLSFDMPYIYQDAAL